MIVLIKEEGDKNMSNTICQRFIDQKQVSTDKLLYSAGRVECGYRRDYFTVADEQIGAKETFSVGQPVYLTRRKTPGLSYGDIRRSL